MLYLRTTDIISDCSLLKLSQDVSFREGSYVRPSQITLLCLFYSTDVNLIFTISLSDSYKQPISTPIAAFAASSSTVSRDVWISITALKLESFSFLDLTDPTLCFVHSGALFHNAFLTCSTGCWADTVANVQTIWHLELLTENKTTQLS